MPKKSLRVIFEWRMFVNFLFGISSGLPLLTTASTLQAWMTQEGISLKVIGLLALVQTPYTLKWLWSPFMDRYVPPFLGRRRGWILICQVLLALATAGLSFLSPAANPLQVGIFAVLIAFFSASQDIVIDAYRREILNDEELGLGSSLAVNGYRVGILISGALALLLADHISWHYVYLLIASTYIWGTLVTINAPDSPEQIAAPKSLGEAVVGPILEYFRRRGAIEILLFILLYKIGEALASNLTVPFYLSLGFTKTDIGAIAKTFGIGSMLLGSFLGGVVILEWGIRRSLFIFGVLQGISILTFSILANVGKSYPMLMTAIVLEYVASGAATSAFVAFMASMTNKKFTATQFALLSSLIGIPRSFLSAPTGYLAAKIGWVNFFIFCTLTAIPGLLLLLRFNKWQEPEPAASAEALAQ